MLRTSVRSVKKGDFQLEVDLVVESQRPLVLVGESGAGKTTFLELLAGLTQPASGTIVVDGTPWFDGEAEDLFVAPQHRSIGYVAQEATLFPHLSVVENVAFGLRASGGSIKQSLGRAREALSEIGLVDLANRRPKGLSGGQQQRVTLARALCLKPRVLLLDEPLSSLDIQTKQSVRSEILRVIDQLQCITVYVTHDPLEALTIADRVAVMEGGRITQIDDRAGLLRQPRSHYVGRFVGVNLFRGTTVHPLPNGMARVTVDGGALYVVEVVDGGELFLTIDPRHVTLSLEMPAGSAQNVFRGQIVEMTPTLPGGDRVRVALSSSPPLVAEITQSAAQTMELSVGAEVYASVKATAVTTYQ